MTSHHQCDASLPSLIDDKAKSMAMNPLPRRRGALMGVDIFDHNEHTLEGMPPPLRLPPLVPQSQKRPFFHDIGFAPLLPYALEEQEDLVQDGKRSSKKRIKLSPRFEASSHFGILSNFNNKMTGNVSFHASESNHIYISDDDIDDAEEEKEEEETSSTYTGTSMSDSKKVDILVSRGQVLEDAIETHKSSPSMIVKPVVSSGGLRLKPIRRSSFNALAA
eukprot:scaffold624_cov176-Amphora_coffeaeformis.AAC.6